VIFSADAEGNEFQLTPSDRNAYRPKLNRAAQKVGFYLTEGADLDLYTMDLDGSNWRQVTRTVKPNGFNLNELGFAWPADSDMMYYPQFDKLFRINSNGQGRELVYQTPDGSFISELDVSENDDIIVLKTNNAAGYEVQIYTIDFEGNVLDTILSGVLGGANGVSLSVTNQLVIYSYDVSGFQNNQYRRLDSRLFQYNLVDDTTIDISGDKPAGTNDLDPTLSPNEAFVIFVNTDNDMVSQRDVYQVEIDPEDDGQDDPRELLFSNAYMPNWE
jgi:Tol biopolymer transport system component